MVKEKLNTATTKGTKQKNVKMEDAFKEVKEALSEIVKQLRDSDWEVAELKKTDNSKRETDFILLKRSRNLKTLAEERGCYETVTTENVASVSEMVADYNKQKSCKINVSDMVSDVNMGRQNYHLTPSLNKIDTDNPMFSLVKTNFSLPTLSDFGRYESLRACRSDKDNIVISFDSEWFYTDEYKENRILLSWQFACIDGDMLKEYVFIKCKVNVDLTLEVALGIILDDLKFFNYESTCLSNICVYKALSEKNGSFVEKCFNTQEEAEANAVRLYDDGDLVKRVHDWKGVKSIPVTLLCHTGLGDISGLNQKGVYRKDVLKECSSVQGGIVTTKPMFIHPHSLKAVYRTGHRPHAYCVLLKISDTMCHTAGGKKGLDSLGETINWPKIELNEDIKSHMDKYLINNSLDFLEYASNDAVVTLLYAASLYGYNKEIPITLTSAAAKVMKENICEYMGITEKEFDKTWRGIKSVKNGKRKNENCPGYLTEMSKEPISNKARMVQIFASQAFHGGYNNCNVVGYYPIETYDYDIMNAYPTAMCLVPDVDWDDPIECEITDEILTIDHFKDENGEINPLRMILGYVKFRFSENVMYPTLPIYYDKVPVYPRTSDGVDGIYASGPELYVALCLGAEIHMEKGYVLNTLHNAERNEDSYSLRYAVKQIVKERSLAEQSRVAKLGSDSKRSLEEEVLKSLVNRTFGKVGQNVIRKTIWDAHSNEMKEMGASIITNPVSACMITGIIRAVLLAAQNELNCSGYDVYSVTTDGFISNAPEEVILNMKLYGLSKCLESARLFLTDGESGMAWAIKHYQTDLVNFCTRGNVSLQEHGVCAHNSVKSGFKSDSFEDRYWLMKEVVSRTGRIEYIIDSWTTFKEVINGKPFSVTSLCANKSMDYDMKRKPNINSFKTTVVDILDKPYEMENFKTVPFENLAEFIKYRSCAATVKCLKTKQEWDLFHDKLKYYGSSMKGNDISWGILMSVIRGHRLGRWNIPMLDELSGQARVDWINKHNNSQRQFKSSDWKNCGRSERQASMLETEFIKEKILEMIEDKLN